MSQFKLSEVNFSFDPEEVLPDPEKVVIIITEKCQVGRAYLAHTGYWHWKCESLYNTRVRTPVVAWANEYIPK